MSLQLFLGDDLFALEQAVNALEEATLAPGWPKPEPPASWQDALEALATPAFFGGRIIKLQLDKASADTWLEDLAGQLPLRVAEGNLLIIVAEGVDRRKKGYKDVAKVATVREFPLPKAWDAEKVMVPRARLMLEEQGFAAEPAALGYLIEAVGVDTLRLRTEIDKICTAAGPNKQISLALVKRLVSHQDGDLFELLGALAKGDKGTALLEINRLLLVDPAYKIIPGLASNLRTVMHLLRLTEAREPDVAQKLGLNPFRMKILLGEWRRRHWQEIEKALEALLQVDLGVKSTPIAPQLLLEAWVVGFPS